MDRERYLRIYLYLFGLGNLITAYAIPLLFGDALPWTPRNLATDLMVGSVYFALSIVMILAARNPLAHKAFIDFIIVANILHALIMVLFAHKIWHVVLDAGYIGMMGLLPLIFYPWGLRTLFRYPQRTGT